MRLTGWTQRASCKRIGWFVLAGVALLSHDRASAQLLQGTIDGNVTDTSQAAIAGVTVTATNPTNNFTRETITNSAGGYTLPTLPPGVYTITVKALGFQTVDGPVRNVRNLRYE